MTIRMTKRVTDVGTDMESTHTGAVFTIFVQHTRHRLACFDNVDVLVFASPLPAPRVGLRQQRQSGSARTYKSLSACVLTGGGPPQPLQPPQPPNIPGRLPPVPHNTAPAPASVGGQHPAPPDTGHRGGDTDTEL